MESDNENFYDDNDLNDEEEDNDEEEPIFFGPENEEPIFFGPENEEPTPFGQENEEQVLFGPETEEDIDEEDSDENRIEYDDDEGEQRTIFVKEPIQKEYTYPSFESENNKFIYITSKVLVKLFIQDTYIKSLFLQCPNLEEIYCKDVKILSLSKCNHIKKINGIKIENINMQNVTNLNDLPIFNINNKELKMLTFDNSEMLNNASLDASLDISNISQFKNLNVLYIVDVNIKNVNYINTTFKELNDLELHRNNISTLDISDLSELSNLSIYGNKIKKINISNNTKLESVFLADNTLKNIIFGNNFMLRYLELYNNEIDEIDISNLLNLNDFIIDKNILKEINISNNNNLTHANLKHNMLEKIIFGNNDALYELELDNNKFIELIIPENIKLYSLRIDDNSNLNNIKMNTDRLKDIYYDNVPYLEDLSFEEILKKIRYPSKDVFKKATKKVIELIKTKGQIYKWEAICKNVEKLSIKQFSEDDKNIIKEYTLIENVPIHVDAQNNFYTNNNQLLSTEMTCKSLKSFYENKINSMTTQECNNETSMLGDMVNDILKPFLYKFKDNGKIYCFNILELYEYIEKQSDKNPYTRNELPVKNITEEYEKIKKLVIPTAFAVTNILEDIKNTPILSKEKIIKQKLSNIFSQMHYSRDIIEFMNWPIYKFRRLSKLFKEYGFNDGFTVKQLMNFSDEIDVQKKKESIFNIIISLFNIDDDRKDIRRQNLESLLNDESLNINEYIDDHEAFEMGDTEYIKNKVETQKLSKENITDML